MEGDGLGNIVSAIRVLCFDYFGAAIDMDCHIVGKMVAVVSFYVDFQGIVVAFLVENISGEDVCRIVGYILPNT